MFKRIFGRRKESAPEVSVENMIAETPEILLPSRPQDDIEEPAPAPIEKKFPGEEEILKEPVDFLIVHADDEQYWNSILASDKGSLFGHRSSESTHELLYANSWEKVFVLAMKGNAGKQAEVVILDHKYEGLRDEWRIRPKALRELLDEAGIEYPESLFDFSFRPEQIEDSKRRMQSIAKEFTDEEIARGDESKYYMPGRLFGKANSVDFSLLLRVLGYSGKLVIMSSNPPTPSKIHTELDELNATLRIDLPFPVNGCIAKNIRNGELYISDVQNGTFSSLKEQGHWDDEDVPVTTLAEGMSYLLSKLMYNNYHD